jgi:hypothetical protein
MVDHVPYLYAAQALIGRQIANYIKFPPRQKVASFNLDSVMASLGPARVAAAKEKALALAFAKADAAKASLVRAK